LLEALWDGKYLSEAGSFNVRYQKANEKFRGRLKQLYLDDLSRLKHMHHTGRIFIESYEDSQERFTKLKQSREYRFITHPKRERD